MLKCWGQFKYTNYDIKLFLSQDYKINLNSDLVSHKKKYQENKKQYFD